MARQRSAHRRDTRLVAPASEQELRRYIAACAKLKMEPADTLRKLADAFIVHADEHGYIVQPLKFAPPPCREELATIKETSRQSRRGA